MKRWKRAKVFHLNGPLLYRMRSLLAMVGSSLYVSYRRLVRGPQLPGWTWKLEVGTHFLRYQTVVAFGMQDVQAGRKYGDSLIFASHALAHVKMEPASFTSGNGIIPGDGFSRQIHGHWLTPVGTTPHRVMLYLHGGGYAYYSKFHANLIALVTLAAGCRTFALDYRLIPEHPFPAQLDDAVAAYTWLIESGVETGKLVIAGDSAGGNLTLALLLALREAGKPLPSLAVCISPWTDMDNGGESMENNQSFDWLQKRMTDRWAEWLHNGGDPHNPLLSPIHADLRGLPHIFIQTGETEILFDMIRQFAENAKKQGANVALEVWENMNHDFQAYGNDLEQSRAALAHIGRVVRRYTADQKDEITLENIAL